MILAKIEGKNEEILQKKETHRHKLNEVHEAYKREIQKENERHVDDLKVGLKFKKLELLMPTTWQVTERGITELRGQLDELEQLQGAVSRQLPVGAPGGGFVLSHEDLLRALAMAENVVCFNLRSPGIATARGDPSGPGRLRDLLECPVCMEEMKPPKKIFQCSNGHVICEHCKNNPEVRVYKVNGLFVKYQLIFVPGAQLSNL